MHVKKGDKVKVLSGKDKGKSGVILRAMPKDNAVIIEGVAVFKRSIRGAAGKVGRIIEKSRPINASNVMKLDK
jgi:large subunit ribosomal protein L24